MNGAPNTPLKALVAIERRLARIEAATCAPVVASAPKRAPRRDPDAFYAVPVHEFLRLRPAKPGQALHVHAEYIDWAARFNRPAMTIERFGAIVARSGIYERTKGRIGSMYEPRQSYVPTDDGIARVHRDRQGTAWTCPCEPCNALRAREDL